MANVFFPTLRYKIWEKEYFISVLRQSLRWLELAPQKKPAGRWQVEVFPRAIFLGGCNTVVHLQVLHSLSEEKGVQKSMSDEGPGHNLSGKKFRSRSDVVPHG